MTLYDDLAPKALLPATVASFFEIVVRPSVARYRTDPLNVEYLVSACSTIVACFDHYFYENKQLPELVFNAKTDNEFRKIISDKSAEFDELRKLNNAMKHGGEAFFNLRRITLNQCGVMECGDSLGEEAIVVDGLSHRRLVRVVIHVEMLLRELICPCPSP